MSTTIIPSPIASITTKTIRGLIRFITLPRLRQGQTCYPWRLPHGNANAAEVDQPDT